MKWLLLLSLSIYVSGNPISWNENVDEWWKTDVFYQIYPRSFKDTDGDGIGDLKGITEKLPYLRQIGINSTWLSPIFKSPMKDAGYDISDYRSIDPIFGTLEDFDKLLAEAKELGIRIILDFVPNHTSDKHEWFQKSLLKIDPYTDYYVWNSGKLINGTRYPPNNWISPMAHSSAWEWSDERQQYYYHRYAKEMIDLDYRNPKVVEEMKEVLRFWLRKGVAGFRVDAISRLFEDEQLRDIPLSNKPGCSPVDECYLVDERYVANQPETVDMVIQWKSVLKEFEQQDGIARVMMTESYSPLDIVFKYYGNSTHDGASFPFNFLFITNITNTSIAADYKHVIDSWINGAPSGRTANWVLGNHDRSRVASRLQPERADGLNMLIMTLPGAAVTYMGEEFGMENGFVSWEDTQDPKALSVGKDKYLEVTRDPSRTPFHWNGLKNAGFSSANKTWLPVSDKYKACNVKLQIESKGETHLKVYQQLIQLRENEILRNGTYQSTLLSDNVLAIIRENKGKFIYSIINLGGDGEIVDLKKITNFGRLIVKVNSVASNYPSGLIIKTDSDLIMKPFEALILGMAQDYCEYC